MHALHSICNLRDGGWKDVPRDPGVYWWYFPASCLDSLRIAEHCDVSSLSLRRTPDGKTCLYHGCASSLRQRVKWHAAQRLRPSALKSGFLSTFRFTLLSLNGFDYLSGESRLNGFMDELEIGWQAFPSKTDARAFEAKEIQGPYHYPLNIQENRRIELGVFRRHLKTARKEYKRRYQ